MPTQIQTWKTCGIKIQNVGTKNINDINNYVKYIDNIDKCLKSRKKIWQVLLARILSSGLDLWFLLFICLILYSGQAAIKDFNDVHKIWW